MENFKREYPKRRFLSIRTAFFVLLFILQAATTEVFAQHTPFVITCGKTINESKIALDKGIYKMYVKVWIDTGASLLGFKTSINPVENVLTWEFKDVAKGQWVTLSKEFTVPSAVVNQTFSIEVLEDEYNGAGYGNFYVDDFYIEFISVLGTEDFNINEVAIFPSPTSELVNVNCPEGSVITVYNILGIAIQNIKHAQSSNTIQVSNLASGIYFVKVQLDSNQTIKKIVVK
ncbi:T9SS type A sorting domain-containing protein [Flavobacterium ovatum]|uniref:T9SS type A sorting domain-containing protein n=1 Tax=Flavobacterium ovatum TaxID=1928857 RepID=UPI00344CC7E2